MKFLLSKKRQDKSHILDEFNSAMMVTRYDDIMAHNWLNPRLLPTQMTGANLKFTIGVFKL